MKAVVKKTSAPGIEVMEVPIPEVGEGEILVQVKESGICGSDVHVYEWQGGYEWLEPFLPRVLGHEFAGEVVETGPGVTMVKKGDRVLARTSRKGPCGRCEYCRTNRRHFCVEHYKTLTGWKIDGGFAEFFKTSEEGVVKLPDCVSYEEAALAEPISIGASAVNDARLIFGDIVVVIGPGTIGLLTLLMAKSAGAGRCMVCGTSQDKFRLEKALELGADVVVNADKEDLRKKVMEMTGGMGADIVFECSGASSVVQTAVDISAKVSGRVILEGIYAKPVMLELSNSMVRSARMIRGSYSGFVAWERTVEWIASNREKARQCCKIITHRTKIDDAAAAFERSVRKENIKEMFTEFT